MEKKLPEIFQNKIYKKLDNNKNIFYSKENNKREDKEESTKVNELNIYQKSQQGVHKLDNLVFLIF